MRWPERRKAARLVLWLAGSVAVVIAAGIAVGLMVTGVPDLPKRVQRFLVGAGR